MKIYAYLALAIVLVGGFSWAGLTLYKAGWNAHVAENARHQAKLEKRMDDVKAASAVALEKSRRKTETQRRKYRDTIRVLRTQNKEYADWAAAHIPDVAVDIIWLRRE